MTVKILSPKPRIIFMGTPEFAVASLQKLLEHGFEIITVITAPDKPAGRGLQMKFSAVKKFALQHNLPILQPTNLKNPAFLQEIKNLKPDIQIVVAFRKLPDILVNIPLLGTINLHASLLPQYRGAAPINWVIINGEKETGVTIIRVSSKIDCGNILNQLKIPIALNDNAGILHDILKEEGSKLLINTVYDIMQGKVKEIFQDNLIDEEDIIKAPKLTSENCKINFTKTVEEISQKIRGLSPYPGAYTFLDNKLLKIYKCSIEYCIPDKPLFTDKKTYFKMACSNGYIILEELQIEGKKRMSIEQFLKGYRC
ncbi:MAG: methionyl-tRNA formyltransferase [Chitinophagaceae bacterium]